MTDRGGFCLQHTVGPEVNLWRLLRRTHSPHGEHPYPRCREEESLPIPIYKYPPSGLLEGRIIGKVFFLNHSKLKLISIDSSKKSLFSSP
jgi:hypothetical protein